MDTQQLYGLGAVPVITGLIEVFKKVIPEAPERIWPLVALIFGIAFNLLLGWRLGVDLWVAAIFGVIVGLSASGLYSQGKTYIGSGTPK